MRWSGPRTAFDKYKLNVNRYEEKPLAKPNTGPPPHMHGIHTQKETHECKEIIDFQRMRFLGGERLLPAA